MGLSGRVGSMKGRKILPFCCCVLCRELPSGGVRWGRGHFDSKSELLKGYFESSAPYFVKFIVVKLQSRFEHDLLKAKPW